MIAYNTGPSTGLLPFSEPDEEVWLSEVEGTVGDGVTDGEELGDGVTEGLMEAVLVGEEDAPVEGDDVGEGVIDGEELVEGVTDGEGDGLGEGQAAVTLIAPQLHIPGSTQLPPLQTGDP